MRSIVVALVLGLVLIMSSSVGAQSGGEYRSPLAEADLSQYVYSYGTVLRVSETELVVIEYEYDSDEEREITYRIDASTELDGFSSILELVLDDVIEIYYIEENGQRVARIIHRELFDDELSLTPETL